MFDRAQILGIGLLLGIGSADATKACNCNRPKSKMVIVMVAVDLATIYVYDVSCGRVSRGRLKVCSMIHNLWLRQAYKL
jgi:hypothetical protein